MTGGFLPDAGFARYAGIAPSGTGIFTSPATSPPASVVIVSAPTGRTARANPADNDVTRNLRRLYSVRGIKIESAISLGPPAPLLDRRSERVHAGLGRNQTAEPSQYRLDDVRVTFAPDPCIPSTDPPPDSLAGER